MKTLLTLLLLTSINIAYAQTCTLNIINTTPDNRYNNNNNGTITDNRTKLMWKQCSEGQTWVDGSPDTCTNSASIMDWQAALILAGNTTFAGKSDWQLPNIKQLQSIVTNHCYNPSINQTHFPMTPANEFWSSSPYAEGSSRPHSWLVDFYDGDDISNYIRFLSYRVRLVRPVE